eukprot:725046_1
MATANDLLKEVRIGSIPRHKADGEYIWQPYPEYPSVKFYWAPNSTHLISSIAGFMIPVAKSQAPAWNNMIVGGCSAETNTPAEVVNRYLKYIEDLKDIRLDLYVWHRRSIVYKFAKAWLVRYRQGLANYYCSLPGFEDMWRGKGFKASASTAFSIQAKTLFDLLVGHETDPLIDMKRSSKKIMIGLSTLMIEDGVYEEYGFNKLSNSFITVLKKGQEITYTNTLYQTRSAYFVLWMAERLVTVWNHTSDDLKMRRDYPWFEFLEDIDDKFPNVYAPPEPN